MLASPWATTSLLIRQKESCSAVTKRAARKVKARVASRASRFWPADTYREGTSPPSFDKQFVRDYLETLDWNKKAPGPRLPADIIEKTRAKYLEALTRLTRA